MSAQPAQSENAARAAKRRERADVWAQQGADGFRVAAWRRGAAIVEGLDRPVRDILATQGRQGLIILPGIGYGIAAALAEMVTTGHWTQLDRLRGTGEPGRLFRTIPGIGPELGRHLCDALDTESLEALEIAAHDGSLEKIEGIGPRRAQMIRAILAERLGRPRLQQLRATQPRPPVDVLLDVDREYRDKARAGELLAIAPRRFNPEGKAWLPILHTSRGGWDFTALYSNTGLAHELNRIGDWVVIYYHADTQPEGQCTVVTETRGRLIGTRVVRGREAECEALAQPASQRGQAWPM